MRSGRGDGEVSLGKQVATAIRKDIIAGAIPPDSILVQERLCETYDVSRIPVRDALITLLHEGFVARNHRNQMVATRFSTDDVIDTFQIEALLCGFGARRAAANLTDDDLERLDGLLRRAELAGDPPERSVAAPVAWEFHRIINRGASSPRLTAALRAVTITFAQDHMREVPEWWRESRRHHREILEALAARDADEAEHRMRRHFELAGECFAGFLAQRALTPCRPGGSTRDDAPPG
jgi:DNA-binding GntR family transcriptional regulator